MRNLKEFPINRGEISLALDDAITQAAQSVGGNRAMIYRGILQLLEDNPEQFETLIKEYLSV